MTHCRYCGEPAGDGNTLCGACEWRFFALLIRCARDVEPLRDSLDATLHPGGHAPVRVQPATPPTPLRLDVLDLIDQLDAVSHELLRRLDGIDAHPDGATPPTEDLKRTLWDAAGHPMLARIPDAGMYMASYVRLSRMIDAVLDPPEPRREIGTCELCGAMLTAGRSDDWVTCPVCEREQRVQSVRLRRLKLLCWDESRRGSAADIARAFTDAGIPLKRNTLNVWRRRGKLDVSPRGILYSSVYRLVISGEPGELPGEFDK